MIRSLKTASLSVLVLFLWLSVVNVAYSGNWRWGADEEPPAPAEAATVDKNLPLLTLVEFNSRDLDGSPALSLTFSEPLDPRRDYNPLIKVFEMPTIEQAHNSEAAKNFFENKHPLRTTIISSENKDVETEGGKLVKGAWVVGKNPRLLYFPHIKPMTRYVVRVMPGIPGKLTQPTNAEARYSIVTPEIPAASYFASKGMVLPTGNNGGLPVVTVNVPEVDMQFMRVKPEQIPRFLDMVIRGKRSSRSRTQIENEYYVTDSDYHRDLKGAVNHWILDDIHPMSDSVYAGRFLTEQKPNRRSVTFIPVEDIKELREPGIYIAVMNEPGRFRYDYQTTYFYVSNLGLSLRLFDGAADAYVSSLSGGKAVRGVDVSWLDENGKILLQGKTDNQGHVHFSERPRGAKVVMARHDKEVSIITLKEPALDLSEYNIGGTTGKPVNLFAYTGRNLYRPGEKFDVSVLVRNNDGQPVPAQPIMMTLMAPDGTEQFSVTCNPDARFSGYYKNSITLPADAATGLWTLELRADFADDPKPSVYRFNVEEFLPERMKLDLDSKQTYWNDQSPYQIDITGTYLYGAPASGNSLLSVVQGSPATNPLADKLPGFFFGDAREETNTFRDEYPSVTLDATGKKVLTINLEKAVGRNSPYQIRTTVSLLESGGRPVIRSLEKNYWPAPELLGLRPLFDGDYAKENSPASFEVVRVDPEGKFSGGTFPVRLFREDRHWYWSYYNDEGWRSGFTETDELVASDNVTFTASKRGKITVPVEYGRYRVEILDPETSKRLVYRFYAGWYASTEESQGVRPDLVTLKFDKPSYREGETARLTIKPPHAGEALVTVEGDTLLWMKRLTVGEEGKTIEIPIAKDWTSHNLYASAIVLRPGNDGDKVTPARALGIAYLALNRDDRTLAVALDTPAKIEPNSQLKTKIRVPGAQGKKAQVTLSAVDVGILNITRFKSPNPVEAFFGKQRYSVDQHDIYGRLIEKMTGKKGKLKFGGDTAPETMQNMPGKVKLIDLFSGPVALNAAGEAEITLSVPDFNGKLRLMAVVATPNQFGNAEAEVTVAAPLVAELSMPRFLTIGDKATFALDLHNLSGQTQKLNVAIQSARGLVFQNAKQSVTLKDQEKTTLRYSVEAGDAFGLTPITVSISGGVTLKREFALEVEAPTPRQQVRNYLNVEPGKTITIRNADLEGFLPGTVYAHLSASTMPPMDITTAVQGLLMYPYGCTEQTTSSAYPHIFIDAEQARKFGLKEFTDAQRTQMISSALARLSGRQAPNGGFSLWGNASYYEYWLSAYVGNFMLDARGEGFAVPEDMQQRTMDFLFKNFQEGVSGMPTGKLNYDENSVWRDRHYAGSGRFAALAYGAYVLARESRAPLSTTRQLYDLREQAHSNLSLVHLGIALHLMGDSKRAQQAIDEAMSLSRPKRYYDYYWGDYGSELRDSALAWSLLQRHQLKAKNMDNLIPLIAELIKNRGYYTSTQEKLAVFMAGNQLLTTAEKGDTWPLTLSTSAGEKKLTGKGNLVQEITAADLRHGVKVQNPGKNKLFLELSLEGNPKVMPAERRDAIKLRRTYYDAQGKLLGKRPLEVGETLWVALEINPKFSIGNALVVDRVPAGFEIENVNLIQGEDAGHVTINGTAPAQAMNNPNIDHVEYRDDRFVAAVRLQHYYGNVKLFYRMRVVTPGTFIVPPLYAEDMYRPTIYGLTDSKETVTVIDKR